MDQAADIQRVAEDIVRRLGEGAYDHLYDNAQVAKQIGDIESAITWWDIALAAVELLNERKGKSTLGSAYYLTMGCQLASST